MVEAREAVPEPTQPNGEANSTQRLKLKMPAARAQSDAPGQKIMLRVGGAASRHSTGPRAASSVERAVAPAATPEAEGGRLSTTPGAMPSEIVTPAPMMTTPGTSTSSSVDRMDIGNGSPVPPDPGQHFPAQAVTRATGDAPGAMLPPPSVVPGATTTSPVPGPPAALAPSPSHGTATPSSIQSRVRPKGTGTSSPKTSISSSVMELTADKRRRQRLFDQRHRLDPRGSLPGPRLPPGTVPVGLLVGDDEGHQLCAVAQCHRHRAPHRRARRAPEPHAFLHGQRPRDAADPESRRPEPPLRGTAGRRRHSRRSPDGRRCSFRRFTDTTSSGRARARHSPGEPAATLGRDETRIGAWIVKDSSADTAGSWRGLLSLQGKRSFGLGYR